MKKTKNLASLPRNEAIAKARAAGRSILANGNAVSPVFLTLWTEWMSANIPKACGQTDDEFGYLLGDMMDAFNTGMDEFIESAASTITPPTPIDGRLAAEGALLLVNAIKWASEAAQEERDFSPLQAILDVALPELGLRIEVARRAVSACR